MKDHMLVPTYILHQMLGFIYAHDKYLPTHFLDAITKYNEDQESKGGAT